MKTQKNKLVFGKASVIELNQNELQNVQGGTSTFTMPSVTITILPPNPDPFPDPFPNPLPMPTPIPGTGTLPW